MNLPKHKFWGAGEQDCPPELKAPNGELHTMRCKVCGDGWRKSSDVCLAAAGVFVPATYSGWLWTHNVRGGEYRMIGTGKLQTDKPLQDMAEVVLYQGEDGRLWVRAADEWGSRFKRVRPDPAFTGATIAGVPTLDGSKTE